MVGVRGDLEVLWGWYECGEDCGGVGFVVAKELWLWWVGYV